MAIDAEQADGIAVDQDLLAACRHRANAETLDHGIAGERHGHRVQVRALGRPGLEIGHFEIDHGAVVLDGQDDLARRRGVEADADARLAGNRSAQMERQAYAPRGHVKGGDDRAFHAPLRQVLQAHAAVDAAEGVEIVVGVEEFGPMGSEPVVNQDLQIMAARRGLDVIRDLGIRGAAFADETAVPEHPPVEPHASDDQPPRALVADDAAAIDADAADVAGLQGGVEDAGNGLQFPVGKRLGRHRVVVDIAEPAEVPDAVKTVASSCRMEWVGIGGHRHSLLLFELGENEQQPNPARRR